MTYSDLTTLIGSVGFPIVMCGVLSYYIYNVQRDLTNAINDLSKMIAELSAKIASSDDGK